MSRALAAANTFLAAATGGLLLAGCGGSGTKASTSSKPLATAPPATGGDSRQTDASSSTSTSASSSARAAEAASGGAQAPAATRTAGAPAYVHEQSPSGELASAVSAVQARGYTPVDTSEYHSDQTLRALIGARAGAGGAQDQQAFFFLGDKYLGTDASRPSAAVAVVHQGDTEVTLAYTLYRPSDPACCGSGGRAHVTFQLDNGALDALQAIPPVSERR